MRNMDIKLRQIESEEFDSLFSVVKQGIYSHVDAVFGWDDDFQANVLKIIGKQWATKLTNASRGTVNA